MNASPGGLAESSGTASWLPSFTQLDGTIIDNVNDALDRTHVFIRIARLTPDSVSETVDQWFNENTLEFDPAETSNTSWKDKLISTLVSTTTTPTAWSYPVGSGFGEGYVYRIDVYAADSAGNSTGTAAVPLFRKYLKVDKNAPVVSSIKISTGSETDNGAPVFSTSSNVGLYLSSNPLNTIRLSISEGAGSGIAVSSYALSYFDGLSEFQWSGSTWGTGASMWIKAVSTTTVPYQVSITSGIEWRNSKQYTLNYFIKDAADNQTAFNPLVFIFDSSAPALSAVNIASGTTFSDSADLPGAISGVVNDEIFGSDFKTAGTKWVGLGVKRQSDGKWYTTGEPHWDAVRNDPKIPAASFSGSNWSLTLGASSGFFWDSRSTDTYFLYVWAQDNVPAPYENITDTNSLKAVFQWEVQVPTSTLILPSTTTNNVWYSSHTGYNLASIAGTAFDLPAGTGSGSDILCAMSGGPGAWPGGPRGSPPAPASTRRRCS